MVKEYVDGGVFERRTRATLLNISRRVELWSLAFRLSLAQRCCLFASGKVSHRFGHRSPNPNPNHSAPAHPCPVFPIRRSP